VGLIGSTCTTPHLGVRRVPLSDISPPSTSTSTSNSTSTLGGRGGGRGRASWGGGDVSVVVVALFFDARAVPP